MAINPFHPTGVGIPGGVGGGVLGLGVVLTLHDQFSKQANLAKAQLAGLAGYVDATVLKLNRSMHMLQASLAGVALGMATLAAFTFPIRSAVDFEKAIQRVRVVAGDRIPKGELESIAIDLAAKFPQSATEMADALRITIAAGITDVYKARHLLDSANMLAVATGSNLTTTIQGFTSFVNAFQLGLHPSQTPEVAAREYNILASQLLEVQKHGKFSASGETTDFEAMAKYFGQIAPTAAALNIEIPELLSLWATATLGGQDARRSATGLRQAFMDLQNRTREPLQMKKFTDWAEGKQINLYGGDLSRFVQEHGFMDFLDVVRDYSGIKDPERLEALLQTPRMQQNFETILNTLPEDMSIEEAIKQSPAAKELVDAVQGVGGMDISLVNEIFRSIWGLTAVLPLIGVQNERMRRTLELVRKAGEDDEVGRAFNAMMNTILYQWQLFTSKVETAGVLIGTTVLDPIRQFLKFLNLSIDAFIALIKVARPLVETIMRIGIAAGMFLSVFFSLMSISSGMKVLNASFMLWMRELRYFPRYVKGGLFLMLKDVFAMTTLLVAASMILRKAWIDDWGMIQSRVTEAWIRIKKVFDTILLLFKRLGRDGKAWLSMEGYEELVELGIDRIVIKLFAVLYRVREALYGFADGIKEFFNSVSGTIAALLAPVRRHSATFLRYILPITNWLTSLFKPTEENVDLWRRWGERIGWVSGLLFVLLGVIPMILRVFQSLSALGSMIGGSLLFFGALNPLLRFAVVLGAVAGGLAAIWKFVGEERLTEFFTDLFGAKRVADFRTGVEGMRAILGSFGGWKEMFGLEKTLRRLLDLFTQAFFGMKASELGGRMKDGALGLLNTIFGSNRAQIIIANLEAVATRFQILASMLGMMNATGASFFDRLRMLVAGAWFVATGSTEGFQAIFEWMGAAADRVLGVFGAVEARLTRIKTLWRIAGFLSEVTGTSHVGAFVGLVNQDIFDATGFDVLAFFDTASARVKQFFEDAWAWTKVYVDRFRAAFRNIDLTGVWRILKDVGTAVAKVGLGFFEGFGGGTGLVSLVKNIVTLVSSLTGVGGGGSNRFNFWVKFWWSVGYALRIIVALADAAVLAVQTLFDLFNGNFDKIGERWNNFFKAHSLFEDFGEAWKNQIAGPRAVMFAVWATAFAIVRGFFVALRVAMAHYARNTLLGKILAVIFRALTAPLMFVIRMLRGFIGLAYMELRTNPAVGKALAALKARVVGALKGIWGFFKPVIQAIGLFFRSVLGPVVKWLGWLFTRLFVNALLWGRFMLAWGKNFFGVLLTIGKGLLYVGGKTLAAVMLGFKAFFAFIWKQLGLMLMRIVGVFLAMNPVVLFALLVAGAVLLALAWKNNLWGIRDWTINLFNSIGEAVKKIWDWFTDTPFGGAVEQILISLFNGFLATVSGILSFMIRMVDAIPGISAEWKATQNQQLTALNEGVFGGHAIRLFGEPAPAPTRTTGAPAMMAPMYGPAAPAGSSTSGGFTDPVVEEIYALLSHPRIENRLRAFEDPNGEDGAVINSREAGLLIDAINSLAGRPIELDGRRLDAALRMRADRGSWMGAHD